MSDSTTAAHPTAKAEDFRKITRLAAARITYLRGEGSSDLPHGCSVQTAFNEIARCRDAERATVIFESVCGGAVLSGQPTAVLPVLAALLTHADSGASGE